MNVNVIPKKFYDHRRADSVASHLRKKRIALFKSLYNTASIASPSKILDIGGTQEFWKNAGADFFEEVADVKVVLLNANPKRVHVTQSNFKGMVGDARDMKQFENNEFDIVFSNSVIEHVGNFNDQLQMANEVKRVGKRYFLQTPNIYFPIEPHFLFPFFQFLPLWARAWLITHDVTVKRKITDKQKAMKMANSVRLLSKTELINLFPNAHIFEEKFFGLTKSFIVYDGWHTT